jgi:DNA-binding IscR family transcriptional regulator
VDFVLAKKPNKITVAEIVDAVEGFKKNHLFFWI